MELEKMKKRSECCILIGRMKYPWSITAMCQDEDILLKNLKALIDSTVVEAFKLLGNKNMAVILQHEFALPRVISLLEKGIRARRFDKMLNAMPVDEIMTYDEEDVRDVLLNQKIWDECMDLYLRYFRTDNIADEELENLCAGLAAFRSTREYLADEWLGEIKEKRMIFTSPVLSSDFLCDLKDYDRWVQLLAENEDLCHLLEELYECSEGNLPLDDENMREMSLYAQRIIGLLEWARSFFNEQQLTDFLELWMKNHALVNDLEFLKRKVETGETVNVGSFLTGRAAYVAFLYDTRGRKKFCVFRK